MTIGSVQSVVFSGSGAACYKASKGGILMLTRAIAAEYAEYNIRANCVCPGGVNTALMDHIAQDSLHNTSQTTMDMRTYSVETPITRFAEPDRDRQCGRLFGFGRGQLYDRRRRDGGWRADGGVA